MDPQYLATFQHLPLAQQITKLESDLLFLRDRVELYDIEEGWSTPTERDETLASISAIEHYLDELH